MTDRIERLLAALVILMALLVVAQTTVVPRNRLLSTIGIVFGTVAVVYGFTEFLKTF
jgi:hypothetical protein